MALQIAGQTVRGTLGSYSAGAPATFSTDQFGGMLVSELHARYAELVLAGAVFSVSSAGAGQAQAAANLFSTAIASAQPIVGIFNPLGSGKNVVILKAFVGISAFPAAATITGAFSWGVTSNQSITQAGTVPTNHLTLKQSGSAVVGLVNQALTGATGSLIVLRPLACSIPPAAQIGTLAGDTPFNAILEEQVEGAIIVPPGGFAGIFNGITGTTATFMGGLTWAEVSI